MSPDSASRRPYEQIAARLHPAGTTEQRMAAVVNALWDTLSTRGVSWVGFYLHDGGDELTLGPSRNKPACSPIGLHGACGRSLRERRPLIVGDVRRLGASYIACDPRDLSEVVVPVFDEAGTCLGVLDLDSYECDAFTDEDVAGLRTVLAAAGLTREGDPLNEALRF